MKYFREIERRLNDGLERTPEEHEKCLKWLVEFATANEMSYQQLEDFCFSDSDWIFEQIFG